MSKKVTFAELMQRFENAPTSCNYYTVDGALYKVVSHYSGLKDIDRTVFEMALTQAFADMCSFSFTA